MYGYDGNLDAEAWLKLGLPPHGLTKADRARLVEAGTLEERFIDDLTIAEVVHFVRAGVLGGRFLDRYTDEDLDLGLDLSAPDYTSSAPPGALLIGD